MDSGKDASSKTAHHKAGPIRPDEIVELGDWCEAEPGELRVKELCTWMFLNPRRKNVSSSRSMLRETCGKIVCSIISTLWIPKAAALRPTLSPGCLGGGTGRASARVMGTQSLGHLMNPMIRGIIRGSITASMSSTS